jgi:succinyl-CoA synthetase beta subunit
MSGSREGVLRLLDLALDTHPRVLLFSAFFQIADCVTYADAFYQLTRSRDALPPIVVRLEGRGADQAHKILDSTPIRHVRSFAAACEVVSELTKSAT